ncbi:hypothetical protein JCM5353_001728 [Sporobolomyces roseus]
MTSTPPNKPLSTLLSSSGTLHPNSSSSSLITPLISSLASPTPHSIDQHLLDLLLNETIRILIESTLYARKRKEKELEEINQDLKRLGLNDSTTLSKISLKGEGEIQQVDEIVLKKLEEMGYKSGWSLSERLSRDRPRFPSIPSSIPNAPPLPDPLEVVKFVCKDLWVSLYDKQVDNLRTNHRGVYVVLDNSLRGLVRLSGEGEEAKRWTRFLLANTAGIVRGCLANLGIQASVAGESSNLPQASFQIKILKPGGNA